MFTVGPREIEIAHAKEQAKAARKGPLVVFRQAGVYGRMLLNDWKKVVRYGVKDREGYEFVARVTPSGMIDYKRVRI